MIVCAFLRICMCAHYSVCKGNTFFLIIQAKAMIFSKKVGLSVDLE